MRELGHGQTLTVLLSPEVKSVMFNEYRKTDSLVNDISAWLLVNGLQLEETQYIQLLHQNLANV